MCCDYLRAPRISWLKQDAFTLPAPCARHAGTHGDDSAGASAERADVPDDAISLKIDGAGRGLACTPGIRSFSSGTMAREENLWKRIYVFTTREIDKPSGYEGTMPYAVTPDWGQHLHTQRRPMPDSQ